MKGPWTLVFAGVAVLPERLRNLVTSLGDNAISGHVRPAIPLNRVGI